MAQVIVAALFAAWFGRVAHHAGKEVLSWAASGAALFLALNVGLMEVAAAVTSHADVKLAGGLVLYLSVWGLSIVAGIAIGVRILPEASHDRLAFELAAQEARAENSGDEAPAETLTCKSCGRSLTKRDALIQGAIRIDDTACVCADCKSRSTER